MADFPKLTGSAALVPLSINPATGKLIFYKDVAAGDENIVLIDDLTAEQKKRLVIERIKAQPGFILSDLNGNTLSQKEIITQVRNDKDAGANFAAADIDYLKDFLPLFKQKK